MDSARAGWRRFGGEDSGFLALELADQPMTNLYLILLTQRAETTPSTVPAPLTLDDVRDRLEARFDVLPALRWKLVPVPYRLHHPIWIDDPDFDLAQHARMVELDTPGSLGQLEALCGRMAAEQLDRSRPLWDVTLVNGLGDGRQALIWRAHHCLMDGLATVTTLARFFADESELAGVERTDFRPGLPPTRRELTRAAVRTNLRNLKRLPKLLRRTGRALKARDEYERSGAVAIPRAPRDVPPCSLNNAFSPERQVTTFLIDLPDVKFVREAAGTSFTNVVLAVIAGGLRTILLEAGDLPSRPLVIGCPIVLDDPSAGDRHWGNRFSNIVTSLATDVEDPWERLGAISTVTDAARRSVELVGEKLWEDWLETLPPLAMSAIVRHLHESRRKHKDVVNSSATVSSVPGPARPWKLGRATVDEVYLNGQPRDASGPAVALFSYAGKLCVGAISVPASLPRPQAFADAARESLAELVQAAEAHGATRAARDSRATVP